MRITLIWRFCCFIALANLGGNSPCVGQEMVGKPSLPHQSFALRIEQIHSSMRQTDYSHQTRIDLSKGELFCDCSGFLDYVLRKEFPEHYYSIRGEERPDRVRPLAVTFHETFLAAGHPKGGAGVWTQITDLSQAQPGDVLAWRKQVIKKDSTTGHVCMIASTPEVVGDGIIRVRLIDSTRSPHEEDSRNGGKKGVGSGFKTFLVDQQGHPIGYLSGQKKRNANIAIGRMSRLSEFDSDTQDADYLGLSKSAAIRRAETAQRRWQVIREDGQPNPRLRSAIDKDRLSFVLEDGKVVRVFRG